jgi:hypothetical protein
MMKPPLELKTPDEHKYYGIDWTDEIANSEVVITDSQWDIVTPLGSPDLEVVSGSISGQVTLVRLSGGQEGLDYTVVNTITTSAPETLQDAIEVRVRSAMAKAGIL